MSNHMSKGETLTLCACVCVCLCARLHWRGDRGVKKQGRKRGKEEDWGLVKLPDSIHWSHYLCRSGEISIDRIWNYIDYEHLQLIKWNGNTFSLSYWKRLNIKKLIFSEIKFINTMIIHLAFIMILLLNHQNTASCAWWEPAGSSWRASLAANVTEREWCYCCTLFQKCTHFCSEVKNLLSKSMSSEPHTTRRIKFYYPEGWIFASGLLFLSGSHIKFLRGHIFFVNQDLRWFDLGCCRSVESNSRAHLTV